MSTGARGVGFSRPRDFLARCIRGIEWIVAAEVETLFDAEPLTLGHREIRFSTRTVPSRQTLQLASADDVFLVVGEGEQIDRHRASLSRLGKLARELPWTIALSDLTRLRAETVWSGFSISASSLGRRNYTRHEIEDHVGEGASAALGLPYRATQSAMLPGPELSIRVHLVGTRATFALRVFDTPLHRREYKQRSCVGTLHPPLAAAMAMVAGMRPNVRLLDPFSGVGTVPIEAYRLQPLTKAVGADIDHARLRDAAVNVRHAGVDVDLARADWANSPWSDGAFSRIVSNVPWGKAVAAQGDLASTPAARDREIARVLDDTGRAVLLVHPEDPLGSGMCDGLPLVLCHRSWLSLFGQHPRLCVLAKKGAGEYGAIDVDAPWGLSLERRIRDADTVEF